MSMLTFYHIFPHQKNLCGSSRDLASQPSSSVSSMYLELKSASPHLVVLYAAPGHAAKRIRLGRGRQLLVPDHMQPLLIAIAYWRAGLFIVVYSDSVTFLASIYFYFPIFETMFNMLNNLFNNGGCFNLMFIRERRTNCSFVSSLTAVILFVFGQHNTAHRFSFLSLSRRSLESASYPSILRPSVRPSVRFYGHFSRHFTSFVMYFLTISHHL